MLDTQAELAESLVIEETEDNSPLNIAPERRRVKTDKQDLPVETLHGWATRGKLNLQPEFQRNFVWSESKASRLIESLLLNIPIPVIYVAGEPNNSFSVVDGQQRLTAICSFINGKFPNGKDFRLSSLQVLTELNRKLFKDLSSDLQEAIMSSVLRLIVIEKDSDPDVKFEIFERLNLGADKLKDQELRNCIYRGSYNNLLRSLAENQHMRNIMGSTTSHVRMMDCQLILRFFAMWRNTHLKYKSPVKQFLNREMEVHRNASSRELTEMQTIFEKSIEMAYVVFGNNAFRRFNPGTDTKPDGAWEAKKLNVALWDTILYTFSYYEKPQIIPIADRIREEFLDLMTHDAKFVEYITSTTDQPERIQYRADVWRQRLQSLTNVDSREPRTFSLKIKQELFNQDPSCQICGQRIRDIDDSEVDHILHYWRGGQTIPSNARLTHRYCNRARGGRA